MKIVRYLLIGVMLLTAGCNVFDADPTASEKLIGIWQQQVSQSEGSEITVINTYEFPDTDRFYITETRYNSEGSLIGYRHFVEGKYELTGNKLTFSSGSVYYSSTDTLYQSVDELKEEGIKDPLQATKYTTEFSNKGQVVKLNYECPPNALILCVEPPVLRKQNVRM